MSNRTIFLERNDETARMMAQAAFPGYNGRTFKVTVNPNDYMYSLTAGHEGGGTSQSFRLVRLADNAVENLDGKPFVGNNFNRMPQAFSLPEGFAIVQHSHFCGKDMGLTILISEANATKLISAPVELTQVEKLVLVATRSLKSSYGPAGSNYRQVESGLSPAVWSETVQILQAKGLLGKNKAITPAGRNAVAGITSLYHAKN